MLRAREPANPANPARMRTRAEHDSAALSDATNGVRGDDRVQRLRELARRLERLTVSRRDPERFLAERKELTEELRAIAVEIKIKER